jgi:RimJ/RimL family protein N-acetyltransferase
MPGHLTVKTKRLELIAGTAHLVRANLDDPEGLARQLDVTSPRISPPSSEARAALESMAQALEKSPEETGWWCWYFVSHDRAAGRRILIGNGGFKGPPDTAGTVEVGYSVLPQFRERGYATEAVNALVVWAFEEPRVQSVIAETARDNAASIRVLDKASFVQRGKGSEESLIRFERTRQAQEGP